MSRIDENRFVGGKLVGFGRFAARLKSDCGSDALVELMGVFRHNPVDDDGGSVIWLYVEVQAVLCTRGDKVVDEIHPASSFEPAVVEVDLIAFDQDVGLEP